MHRDSYDIPAERPPVDKFTGIRDRKHEKPPGLTDEQWRSATQEQWIADDAEAGLPG